MPHPLQVDLLTLKVMSESRATWATPMPILVFLALSVITLSLLQLSHYVTRHPGQLSLSSFRVDK